MSNQAQKPSLVAAVQMTSTNNLDNNLAIAEKLITEAATQGASLVLLPEMFPMMGCPQKKLDIKECFGKGPIQEFMSAQALRHKIWLIGGTMPIQCEQGNKVRAACLTYNPEGLCAGRYDKIHLFNARLKGANETYTESDTTEAGTEFSVVPTSLGKLGLSVCHDLRFPELYRELIDQGAEILLIPSAFAVPTGLVHWEILLRARAIENQAYVIAAAEVGDHGDRRVTYGHSMIINPWGDVIARMKDEQGVIVAPVDLKTLHQLRADMPVLRHRKIGV
jgi:predicted amidohydrolase